MEKQYTGKVKWFSNSKGFGFITNDEDNKDVFVHFSSIISEGYKSLNENDLVKFNLEKTDKGYGAKNVELIK